MKTGPRRGECWKQCKQERGYCEGCNSADGEFIGACCAITAKGHHDPKDPSECSHIRVKAFVKYGGKGYHVCVPTPDYMAGGYHPYMRKTKFHFNEWHLGYPHLSKKENRGQSIFVGKFKKCPKKCCADKASKLPGADKGINIE